MNNADRTHLKWIVQGGATPRILDLWSIGRRFHDKPDQISHPFFRNPRLNASFLIKHTVRAEDRTYLATEDPVVTKVIIPVNTADLSMGGHTFIVEERDFDSRLRKFLGAGSENKHFDADLERLKDLADLPSFDPFLLADRYAECHHPVARHYFSITEADQVAMRRHVAQQIAGVVGLAFGAGELKREDRRALKFAEQLLCDDPSDSMNQLRTTLGLSGDEFSQGIFGWKGTLYYRWSVDVAKYELRDFLREMNALTISSATPAETEQINKIRRSIISEVRNRWRALSSIIDEYDREFALFCHGGDPTVIRRFLLNAPHYFRDLGSDLGVVTHVTSFWKYWWRGREKGSLPAMDAMEIFPNFLRSLTRDSGPESNTLLIA